MKTVFSLLSCGLLAAVTFAVPNALHAQAGGATAAAGGSAFKSQKEKVSYAIGMQIGAGLKQNGVDVDPQALSAAIRDTITGAKPQLSETEMRETLTAFGNEMQSKQGAANKVAGEKSRQEGTAFLATNKAKDGVKTLPDGLQYKVLTAGTGPKPAATDTVKVHYKGTLINGTEFDSSYKRGEPATFPVNGVIKGWTEALQLMPVGSKWQLFIPADLAYGDRGAPGGTIPPGATLIFEVELLGIQGK
jgi:FKBP-type peptidyl-prolyl cis-trans isomerase FklB